VGRARARSALAGLAAAVLGCATYDPFRIPADELRQRVRTIAIVPLRVSAGVADRALARERIEPLVAARLAAGGFQVVGADEVDRLWREAVAEVGDLFDPVTGELDEERFQAVEDAVHHQLRTERGVDAMLWMRVHAVELYLTGAKATFCGTTDAVYWSGEGLGIFESTTLVLASCLTTTLYDMEERELYAIRSGLETIETYARQTRSERPPGERLRDPERLRLAVEATIGPLAEAAGR
jgi:hypothetical protein